jgi:hypothetical protein
VQELAQQQPSGPRADDRHLGAHLGIRGQSPISFLRT